MAIRKATTTDAKSIAAVFNGFVTRHPAAGILPSWTEEMVKQSIAHPDTTVAVNVDGKTVTAFCMWFRDDPKAPRIRLSSVAWVEALDSLKPDMQFVFTMWIAANTTATEMEAIWAIDHPMAVLTERRFAAGVELIPRSKAWLEKGDTTLTLVVDLATLSAAWETKLSDAVTWDRMYTV